MDAHPQGMFTVSPLKDGLSFGASVSDLDPDRLDDFRRVVHPIVCAQPGTGRKVLNLSPWFAVGIQGMENAEGDTLLEQVSQHIIQNGETYFRGWQMGDMVLWDNWRVLYCSSGSPADQERWMQRKTIAGDYGLGSSTMISLYAIQEDEITRTDPIEILAIALRPSGYAQPTE